MRAVGVTGIDWPIMRVVDRIVRQTASCLAEAPSRWIFNQSVPDTPAPDMATNDGGMDLARRSDDGQRLVFGSGSDD